MPRFSAHRACDDFHRASERARSEHGLTRRALLRRGVGAGLAVYAAQAMPFARILEAATAEAAAAPRAPVLVSVFLPGGCDLLDTLTPLDQYGAYADVRKLTRIGDGVPRLPGVGALGLHPSLGEGARGGIRGLFASGKVGLLPGIDYANPDLSHFHSRHFWETGLITHDDASGWLGRWLDRHGGGDNPLQGVSASYDLSPVLRSSRAPVAAVSSPGDAQFWFRSVWGASEDAANEAYRRIAQGGAPNEALAAAKRTASMARAVADRLAPYREEDGRDPLAPPVPYPDDDDFAERLSHLAAMIALPLGIRVATVEADVDFDTHDNQPEELARELARVSRALSAFQHDLEARGIADRVLTFVWSEFGRRVEANESKGTDHGAGGLAWVQGTRVNPGVLSDYPDLKRLDAQGNLAVTVDFRRVYSSLMEQWLGTDASAVIPNAGAFGRVKLVR